MEHATDNGGLGREEKIYYRAEDSGERGCKLSITSSIFLFIGHATDNGGKINENRLGLRIDQVPQMVQHF